jgi:hypothetical protein
VIAVDAATVTAAAVAGLLAGRMASRLTAGLLATPQPPEPPAGQPPAHDSSPPGSPRADRGTRWSLSLGTGLACVMMAVRFGPSPALPAFCYLAGIGVPLAVIDARCQRLPDALTLPSYPVALALLGFAALLLPDGAGHFLGALAGLALACGLFLLQVLLYPAGLGWGDVKLSGLLAGWAGAGGSGPGWIRAPWSPACSSGTCSPRPRGSRSSPPGARPGSRVCRSGPTCWPGRSPLSCSVP